MSTQVVPLYDKFLPGVNDYIPRLQSVAGTVQSPVATGHDNEATEQRKFVPSRKGDSTSY